MNKTDELIQASPELKAPTKTEADLVSKIAAANELAKNPEVVREMTKYGKVPVVYMPKRSILKSMMKQEQVYGLVHFISNSLTVQEVTNHLNRGKSEYKDASPKTIKRWEKAAEKRIAELQAQA